MQSKLVAAKDYHEVALDIPAFVPDQAALQKELDRLRNPYVTWEPGGAVAAGDMVRCSLHSALPRFQKDGIRFVAGSGMYNPTLEALAIGMQAGETRTATLPEGEVALTVQARAKAGCARADRRDGPSRASCRGCARWPGTGAICWRSSGTKPPRRPPDAGRPNQTDGTGRGPRLCSAKRTGSRRWSGSWTVAGPSPGRAAWCWNR